MSTLTPYSTLDDTWDRFLSGFFDAPATRQSTREPKIDVWARDDAFAMTIELPGAKKESIDVSVAGNEVRVSAEIPEIKETNEKVRPLFRERHYGKLTRTIALPHDVAQGQAQARYSDGVLELILPYNPDSLPKKLTVE